MNDALCMAVIYLFTALFFFFIGILFCKQRAGFLLAGWNTMPRREKEKWDEKRLLQFNGRCLIGMGVLLLIGALCSVLQWTWGIALTWLCFVVLIVWMLIYQNTANRFRRRDKK